MKKWAHSGFLSFNLVEDVFDAAFGGGRGVQQDQTSIWVMKCRVLWASAVLQRIVCTGWWNLFLKDSPLN